MKIPMSFQSFRKPIFEDHVEHSTTRSIFWNPVFALNHAHTPAQQRNNMQHREKCAAQGDSKEVVTEEGIAQALTHNISEQTKNLLFLRNNLHLRTHSLSNGSLTLWLLPCELVPLVGTDDLAA